MARMMADKCFQTDQMRRRYDVHIAAVNRFVDELRQTSGRWLPYVPPMYGGVHAKLLSVLRDPGPMTQPPNGSGFVSMENDDPTAESLCHHFAEVGIDTENILPWNVYPWYINRAPSAVEVEEGLEPLRRVIELLPNLRVVMLHGGCAQKGWKRFGAVNSALLESRRLRVIATYHPSRQAFWHRDPEVRERRRAALRAAFRDAAEWLSTPT